MKTIKFLFTDLNQDERQILGSGIVFILGAAFFVYLLDTATTHRAEVEQKTEVKQSYELPASYGKYSNTWTIESAEWDKKLTLKECDDAMQELVDNATENFHEFAFECYHYDPRDDEFGWFI